MVGDKKLRLKIYGGRQIYIADVTLAELQKPHNIIVGYRFEQTMGFYTSEINAEIYEREATSTSPKVSKSNKKIGQFCGPEGCVIKFD